MTRRKLLLGIGSGAGLALLAACGQPTAMTEEAPAAEEKMGAQGGREACHS